jgi:DedD protein
VDEGLKKRLIGATVLVSLVVIFVPMLLEKDSVVSTDMEENIIPDKPEMDFSSRVMPLESEDLSTPPPASEQATKPAPQVQETAGKPVSQGEAKPAVKPQPQPAQRVGLSAWVIQVGSFSKHGNADKLVKTLQGQKYAAFTDQVDVKGKILHRVLVGPEVDKKRAEKMLLKVNKYLKAQKLKGKLKSYP